MNLDEEVSKVAHDFTAMIASVYILSTNKVTLLDLNGDLPGLYCLLKHKQKLRRLWQEARELVCKMAVNWVVKSIRCMSTKKGTRTVGTKNSLPLRTHLMQYGPLQSSL
jgi:hypothetical protein